MALLMESGVVSLIGGRDYNQDVYSIENDLFGVSGQHAFAVLDGHGQHGDLVATAVRDQYTRLLLRDQTALMMDPPQRLYDIFRELQRWLETNPVENMDVEMSGTTLTVALILLLPDPEDASSKENVPTLVVAHSGDSGAMLASLKHTPKPVWRLNTLTDDHSWDNPEERARANENPQARIEHMPLDSTEIAEGEEDLGPLRIYKGTLPYPGLAMSRSLGDLVAHQLGVTWEPSVVIRRLTTDDKFLILASDGLWDVLTMKATLKLGRKCSSANMICETLQNKIGHLASLDNTTIIAVRFINPNESTGQDSDHSDSN